MCASYGLGGGVVGEELPAGLPPLSEKGDYRRLTQWAAEFDGKASITGPRALNFNPLVVDVDGQRELWLGWWSLWIAGQLKKGYSTFNARDDKLLSSAWWRGPFSSTRALLPASWYVEKGRRFELPGGEGFAIAALYNMATANGERMPTYTMVTRASVAEAATVHPRMPLLVPASMQDAWLDPAQRGDAGLLTATVAASEDASNELVIAAA